MWSTYEYKNDRTMDTNNNVTRLSPEFDYSQVPSWYVICTNETCPLKEDCLRFLAGSNVPNSTEIALCVMPKTMKDGHCRLYDRKTIVLMAEGFTTLYDKVMKKDFTRMRKAITHYLHGAKMYYEYKDGRRALTPEQQDWIRNFVKDQGYEWEVKFDHFYESYVFHHHLAAL